MLNEQQIEQLQLLTNHPRYGILLKDAIKTWMVEIPIQNTFGVNLNNGMLFNWSIMFK